MVDPKAMEALAAAPLIRPRSQDFSLKIHEVQIDQMEPIGDRYIVETLPVDEGFLVGNILVATRAMADGPDDDPMNPMAKVSVEKRGVMPAVVCAVGNGHLLGIPDWAVSVQRPFLNLGEEDVVERHPANVPMFLSVGDVCLVDINARGRALRVADRELRAINQIDCLVKLKVRLRWDEKLGWVREE